MAALAESAVHSDRRFGSLERAGLAIILAASAFLNIWNLPANGWANAYYSAAVQAGLHDPVSFFFGSSDWGNAISVDKPPLSLWLIGLSVRVFGLNSWGLLLPQALLGVATTALVFVMGRRYLSPVAGLVGAAVFATTPIVVLMSRYNNPDPLMMFLLLLALAGALRAVDTGRARWAVAVGVALGLAILTKQLQALLVAPALATVLIAGAWGRAREMLLLATSAALPFVVTAASWFAIVELTPKDQRPYMGGSTTNSAIELTFGYNGMQRIVSQDDPVTSLIPAQYRSAGPDTGLFRLLSANYAQEASWLLPAACAAVVLVALGLTRIRRRISRLLAMAGAVWFITAYITLSFMGDQIHTYYTASIGVPMALVLGSGVHILAAQDARRPIRIAAALGVIAATLTCSAILLSVAMWPQWIAWLVLGIGLVGGLLTFVRPPWNTVNWVASLLSGFALLAGPMATSVVNAATPQQGSNPLSGGVTVSDKTISHFLAAVGRGDPRWARDISMGSDPTAGVNLMLRETPQTCTWAAATVPSQSAAKLQLASNHPVLALGGFAASDPWPTLSQFQSWASSGRVCYFVDSAYDDPFLHPASEALKTVEWIRTTFPSTEIDGVRLFRLQ
ncbi:glycosyltransferase family 39 protein [Sinomonas sp. ASV486]|uniref:ArnT family glycosyltransferase n=1 Tax=Sinomonas sp. ASV486 TaxID=3051170 RepID=UPI0027DDCFCE|nr:glycosyltransferase family 39 protein [Sinomonas sp. ASV486]MDQ4488806.1 glycosyltransferase family 39 protein [Sinomonas sp. ASV486]